MLLRVNQLVVVVVLAFVWLDGHAVDFGFEAGYSLEHHSNIHYEVDNESEETAHRSYAGMRLIERGPVFESRTDASVSHFDYENDSYAAGSVQTLETLNTLWILPSRLNFHLDDHLAYVPIDSTALPTPTNQQQINLLSLGPVFFVNISSVDNLQLSYRYEKYDEEIDAVSSADNKRNYYTGQYVHQFARDNELGFNYHYKETDFTTTTYPDQDRTDWFISYSYRSPTDRYYADVGRTNISFTAGLDQNATRANLGYMRQINRAQALRFAYRTELSDVAQELGYSQSVATSQPIVINNIQVSHTGDVFKIASARIEYLFSESAGGLRLSIADEKINYTLQTTADEKRTTYSADYSTNLSDTILAGVTYTYLDRIVSATGRNDKLGIARLSFGYRISSSVSLRGYVAQDKSESSNAAYNYMDKQFGVGIVYQTETMRGAELRGRYMLPESEVH
jgi:hypothetical protein